MISTIVIPIALIIVIILIMSDRVDRLVASLSGAIITTISLLIDSIPFSTIIGFIVGTAENNFVNFHSIILILGMLIIITICQEVGVFSLIAFKIVQMTGGNRYILFLMLSFIAFLFSAILNNILTVLLLIPLTITICKILNVNPIPYIITEALVVNLGGILFVISSIPNILISQSIGWSFDSFFLDVGIYSFILLSITIIFLSGVNKNNLDIPSEKLVMVLKEYDPWYFVRSKKAFFRTFSMLIITIILFITLPIYLSIDIDLIAISSGLLLIIIEKQEIKSLIKKIDFELILYLLGIFLMTDALEYTGLLNYISDWLIYITQGNLTITSLTILWFSAFLSSSIDNAPITKILIPVVDRISLLSGFDQTSKYMVFSTLVYGANLGDNLTPMGDNILVMKIVENYGKRIQFNQFFRFGFASTLIQLIVVTVYILMKINEYFFIFGFIILILIVFIMLFYYYRVEIFKNFKSSLIRGYNRLIKSKKKRIK
ncbi:MAG: SLC13 family permease [Candidatus Helarchaeota archaeon]